MSKAKQQPRVLDVVEEGTANARRRFVRITAKEVSLVDEAANGREFLIVKAAGNKEGTVSTKADRDKQLMKPTTLTVAKAVDLVKEIDAHVTKCAALKDVAVAKAVEPEQFAMFAAMADAIDFCTGTMMLVRADLDAFVASGGTTGFMGESVIKEATVVEKLAGVRDEFAERVCKSVVAVFGEDVAAHKAGRKMAKGRLTKLKEAMKALTELVAELDDEPVSKEVPVSTKPADTSATATPPASAPAPAAATTTTAPAAAPAAPATEGLDATVQKAVEGAMAKTAETIGAAVATAVEKAVAPAVDAAVAKATAGLTDRLTKLESAPAKPAAEGANGTEGDGGGKETTTTKAAGKSFWKGVI